MPPPLLSHPLRLALSLRNTFTFPTTKDINVRFNLCTRSALLLGIVLVASPGSGVPLDALAMEAQPADRPSTVVPSSNPRSGKPEAIEAGRKLYFKWCTQCHGPKADGVSRFGQYAADLRIFWRGYREFVTIVKDGRTARQMPPWKEVLGDEEIAQLGAFLETLAIEGAKWKD